MSLVALDVQIHVPVPRSYISIGKETPETRIVTIGDSKGDDGGKEEEFEMVVLSVGMAPPVDVRKLADKSDMELNAHQLCL